MTKVILNFPIRRSAPLSCAWVTTGNPAQPLAAKWIADCKPAGQQPPDVEEPPARLLCA